MDSDIKINHQEKKQIALRIEKLNNKKYFREIFKIIHIDNSKYTTNDNGVYINLNILSDNTINKIKKYLDDVDKNKNIIPVPAEYIPYYSDDSNHITSSDIKLSNYEKNILKKIKSDSKTLWTSDTDTCF